MDQYSEFIKAIGMDTAIRSPEDMVDFLIRSIRVSNRQHYTNILSEEDERNQRYYQRSHQQRYEYYTRKNRY